MNTLINTITQHEDIMFVLSAVVLFTVVNFFINSLSALIALYRVKADKPVKKLTFHLTQKNVVTLNDHKVEVVKSFFIMMLVVTIKFTLETL